MNRRLVPVIAAVLIAALGTVLVFIYVNGVNDRALAGQNPVSVLVAKGTITVGTSAAAAEAAGDFKTEKVPADALAQGYLSSIDSIRSQLAVTTIVPGQQIVRAEFANNSANTALPIQPGMLAVSVQLTDYGRVAGFVQPGAHVAIFIDASPKALGTGQQLDQVVRTLLPNVEVLAAGPVTLTPQTTTNSNGQTNTQQISQAILTVEVTQQQAEELVFAQDHATLYFALLASGDEQIGPGQPVTGNTVVGS